MKTPGITNSKSKPMRFFLLGWVIFLILILSTVLANAQEKIAQSPRKGSHLYYGQPKIEDNSFLLEEAFNQPTGVIQYISSFGIGDLHQGNFAYSFTQEIPLKGEQHQFSYTLYYMQSDYNHNQQNGFGDLFLSYRPLLLGANDWAMVIPRFTLIVPTGKAAQEFGYGGWGGQFNLAITKRLSRQVITHYNGGYTFVSQADKYLAGTNGDKSLAFEKDLGVTNLGASIIWFPVQKLNLMLEYTALIQGEIDDDGGISQHHLQTLNPGARFCIDNGKMQIVPGISVPLTFENGGYQNTGLFFYLSIEPDYLSFYKAKER